MSDYPIVKPALKKISQFSSDRKVVHNNSTINNNNNDNSSKHLSWDEHAIEEHDQSRGTRMKIEEPNTPFHHYNEAEEEQAAAAEKNENNGNNLCWDTLEKRLNDVAEIRQNTPEESSIRRHRLSLNDSSDEEDEENNKQHQHSEFAKHRSQHYNEIQMARQFREEHACLDEDEDDDDDDVEKMEE